MTCVIFSVNSYIPTQQKTELVNFTENDRMAFQDPSDLQGRNKPNKPDIRLNAPRPEDMNKVSLIYKCR